VDVQCLPPELHNRPRGGLSLPSASRLVRHRSRYATIFVAYARTAEQGGMLDGAAA